MANHDGLKLENGSRVAVIGGGPAGSFFSYFLLEMAERVGLGVHVDIYEPRNFYIPGPPGCNMCGGVLHESLVQSLATEGVNLPTEVVQRGMDSNILHMDVGSVRIETPRHEKRIASTFRGIGPRNLREIKWGGLDGHLMGLAIKKGAEQIEGRVDQVQWVDDPANGDNRKLRIKAHGGAPQTYDLVAVTAGVNTAALKLFEELDFGYAPPRTTKCYVREYYLGEQAVAKYLGPSMHAFMLNIPRLDFGALIPKGDYVTVSLLGDDIDANMLDRFMNDPAVRRCLPPDLLLDNFVCWCSPRINVRGSARPFGDRIVFIGDAGVTRLYKDGIGAAYRAAKAAATTAIFEGISAKDFARRYRRFCRAMENDNLVGKLIFAIVGLIQKMPFGRRAVLRMVLIEQQGKASAERGMSMVLWDMFTGSAPYAEVFLRTLHPVFVLRFLWNVAVSLIPSRRDTSRSINQITDGEDSSAQQEADVKQPKEDAMEASALGKVYRDGEIIVRQGEVGDCMYVVQEGTVEVFEERQGKEVLLRILEEGQFFGEMAIFDRQVRSATVRARGQARVLTVDDKTFLRRVHEDPSLAFRVAQAMSRRVRELSAEVARLKCDD